MGDWADMRGRRFARLGVVAFTLAATFALMLPSTTTPAFGDVSDEVKAQQFVYELNKARLDPSGYGMAFFTGDALVAMLSTEARPPLAVTGMLSAAAAFHSQEMADYNYFAHRSAVTGEYSNALAVRFGYPLPSWWNRDNNYIESISGGRSDPRDTLEGFAASSGHWTHLWGQADFYAQHREIGVGHAYELASTYRYYYTAHTAYRDAQSDQSYLTGVIYDDVNNNNWMDAGEGVSGAQMTSGGTTTTANAGGGWSLPAADGPFTVTATSSNFEGEAVASGVVSGTNVWVELTTPTGGSPTTTTTIPDVSSSGPDPCPAGKNCDSLTTLDTSGRWHMRDSLDADSNVSMFFFGNPGDEPLAGDWNGDGVRTPGLYRQSDGFVYLRYSNTQGVADLSFYFGNPGDVPLVGDFNDDGKDTVSIYRQSEGKAYIVNTLGSDGGGLGAADYSFYFGNPGDRPFVGDFDGDGVDTVGLYRTDTGFAYFRNTNAQGVADYSFYYGIPGDVIVAGDWDGDGDDTVAVYRPADGRFYVNLENAPTAADYWVTVGSFTGAVRTSGR